MGRFCVILIFDFLNVSLNEAIFLGTDDQSLASIAFPSSDMCCVLKGFQHGNGPGCLPVGGI